MTGLRRTERHRGEWVNSPGALHFVTGTDRFICHNRSCSPCCSDRDKKCIVIVIGCAVVPTDDARAASGGQHRYRYRYRYSWIAATRTGSAAHERAASRTEPRSAFECCASDERVPTVSLTLSLSLSLDCGVMSVLQGCKTNCPHWSLRRVHGVGGLPVLVPRGAIVIVTGLRRTERHRRMDIQVHNGQPVRNSRSCER